MSVYISNILLTKNRNEQKAKAVTLHQGARLLRWASINF